MYYAATSAQKSTTHCVDVATSTAVRGPYTPRPESFACHLNQGGAMDAAGHHHPNGNLYIVTRSTEATATTVSLQSIHAYHAAASGCRWVHKGRERNANS